MRRLIVGAALGLALVPGLALAKKPRPASAAMASIEEKGFAFTRNMMDNGTEITRMINTAGETASNNVTRTLNIIESGSRTRARGGATRTRDLSSAI